MYNVAQLRTGFTSLVGSLQSNLPQVPLISSPLTDSLSGIYLQDKHELVSLENIWYSAPDFKPNNYNVWVSGSNYIKGIITNVSGVLYKSLNALTNDVVSPPADETNWVLANPFQDWMQQKFNQGITNLFAEVIIRKKLSHMAKAIMERAQLYRGGGASHKAILSDSSFVGFEIFPATAEGLLLYIDEIGIQTTMAQSSMKFYLYHSSREDAINFWDVPITKANTFDWKALQDNSTPPVYNCIMKYLENNTLGVYYFGYYQSDLEGHAISNDWDCSIAPCYGCDGYNTNLYNLWSRWSTFTNIKVPSSALNSDRTLFDTSKIIHSNVTNWGLNMSMSARCDLTDFIIYSKYLIADVYAWQLAKEFLGSIAKNSRINPTNNQIQIAARADLDPKYPGSWINQYNKALDALNLDLTGFSKVCMPCDNSKKMRFTTI